MSTFGSKLARWADGWKMAGAGLLLAARRWKFWLVVLVVFVLFGTLMGMLSFSSSFTMLFALPDLGDKIGYLWKMFCTIFDLANWPVLLITILQSLLIGLIVLVWRKKRAAAENRGRSGNSLSNAGIVTGLAVLAGGCPTCGTSLLMPVIGAIFSGSSAAVGNTISWILTAAAILIALLTFKKLGEEAYVIIVSEKRRLKNAEKRNSERK